MNLIEKYGSYDAAKAKQQELSKIAADPQLLLVGKIIKEIGEIEIALLEYRRQHNIYEIDDYVVYQGDSGLSGLFRIEKLTKTGKPKSVKSNRFGGFPCRYCEVRHATPEEIKAGRRL